MVQGMASLAQTILIPIMVLMQKAFGLGMIGYFVTFSIIPKSCNTKMMIMIRLSSSPTKEDGRPNRYRWYRLPRLLSTLSVINEEEDDND
ncbi:hypothetical protein Pmar_PMAR019051 [Perkinsus marinus ATCC 50983]|uniref:Uncharacterized protein n=1 Tax=Perkinsus marinus (strain ATCC 50983 / TXsc) TaxID=423536 RepID=C5KTQ7_PERM5|nr:hypothetical protein Pmar_PMAR019051 [Perkinsus marinus ATCC 50983]EER11949.1 hypothetical protein Pmar_PMAR019051 [Perkinsus marinus ATCC 50983]|eukprot:XP_002780154.1 hypothetical protein Pmar_PMAR019051 [Perkinsus marinus ATCC 50983]